MSSTRPCRTLLFPASYWFSLWSLCVCVFAKAQVVSALADNLTDSCCDVPLVCPTLLGQLVNTKWWWYPEISQQERQERDRVWCVFVCVLWGVGWGGGVSGSQSTETWEACYYSCYYSLRGYNKFALFISLSSQHKWNQASASVWCTVWCSSK